MSGFMEGGLPFPKTAKGMRELIGKNIEYVLSRNVDRSGRGYFSTDRGIVKEQHGKNIRIEGDWRYWREIVEYRIIPADTVSE